MVTKFVQNASELPPNVVPGSVTGVAYRGDDPVATFWSDEAGCLHFRRIGRQTTLEGQVNYTTGGLTHTADRVTVSYESMS